MKRYIALIAAISFAVLPLVCFAEIRTDGGLVEKVKRLEGNSTNGIYIDAGSDGTYDANFEADGDFILNGTPGVKKIGIDRNTTADTIGRALTIEAGGATVGGTNRAGGSLVLKTGTATGNATSSIQFYAPNPVGSSGTADNETDLLFQVNNLFASTYSCASFIPITIQSTVPFIRWINTVADADDFFISAATANKLRFIQQSEPASTANDIANWDAVNIGTSGIENCFAFTPFILQSSTAGYTALMLDVTQTSTGSGTKLLLDMKVGGSSKFAIDNTGAIYDPLILSPSTTQSITAAGGITAAMFKPIIRIAGDGGAIDITASPQIADGTDGQVIILQGDDDTNTVKFDDAATLALNGGTSFTLGKGDILSVTYDAGDDVWYELYRSDN